MGMKHHKLHTTMLYEIIYDECAWLGFLIASIGGV